MRTKKCLHKSTVLLLHCTSALNCNDFSSSFPQCGFFNHGGHWGEKNKPRTQRKHLLAKNSPRFIPANKLQTDFHCKGGRQVYKASRRRLQYTEVSQPLLQYGEVWKECTYTLINARSQKHTCVKAVTALQFSRLQSIYLVYSHLNSLEAWPADLWPPHSFLPECKSSHHRPFKLISLLKIRSASLVVLSNVRANIQRTCWIICLFYLFNKTASF